MQHHHNDHPLTSELDRFLTDAEVVRMTSLSRATLWRLRKAGSFPRKVRLSRGRGGTSERALREWMAVRLEHSFVDK